MLEIYCIPVVLELAIAKYLYFLPDKWRVRHLKQIFTVATTRIYG